MLIFSQIGANQAVDFEVAGNTKWGREHLSYKVNCFTVTIVHDRYIYRHHALSIHTQVLQQAAPEAVILLFFN